MKIDFDHIPNSLSAIIETAPLKDAIAQLRQYYEEQNPPAGLAAKLQQVLRALTRHLARAQGFNARVWTKFDMLHDPSWRAKVTEDLGGEPALAQWEARKARAETEDIAPRITAYVPGAQPEVFDPRVDKAKRDTPETQQPRQAKTDRSGLFRLAPIKQTVRPLSGPEQFLRAEAITWRRAMTPKTSKRPKPTSRFVPIPVSPEELRGETNITYEHVAAFYTPYKRPADYSLPDDMASLSAPDIMQAMLEFDCQGLPDGVYARDGP